MPERSTTKRTDKIYEQLCYGCQERNIWTPPVGI